MGKYGTDNCVIKISKYLSKVEEPGSCVCEVAVFYAASNSGIVLMGKRCRTINLKLFTIYRFTHMRVDNLSSNHEYQFRVVAENLYGRSEACEPTGTVKTEGAEKKRTRPGYEFGE